MSKVVLCILHPSGAQEVNGDAFLDLLTPLVRVKRIRVFQLGDPSKAFVQFEDQEAAESAVRFLDRKKVSIGKLKAYISQKDIIHWEKPHAPSYKNFKTGGVSVGVRGADVDVSADKSAFSPREHFTYRDTDLRVGETSKRDTKPGFKTVQMGANNLEACKPTYLAWEDPVNQIKPLMHHKTNQGYNTGTIKDSINRRTITEGRFVWLESFNTAAMDSRVLFNMIGTTGNALVILFDWIKGFAVVEMETAKMAKKVCECLDSIKVFSSTLCARPFEQVVDWDKLVLGQESTAVIKNINPKYFRYKPGLNIRFNIFSKTLHVTNVANSFSLTTLCLLFSKVQEPTMMQELSAKGSHSKMYLVEFEGVSEALEVLSFFHDKEVHGSRLKLSFSQMRVDPSARLRFTSAI